MFCTIDLSTRSLVVDAIHSQGSETVSVHVQAREARRTLWGEKGCNKGVANDRKGRGDVERDGLHSENAIRSDSACYLRSENLDRDNKDYRDVP